jgi:hypothetical protein
VTPYNASELVFLNFTSDVECWFNLRPNTSAGFGANSDHFTLLAQERSTPITIGLNSEPPATITAATTSMTMAGGANTQPTTTASGGRAGADTLSTGAVETGGLSDGAKIGLGIGLGVGLSILIAVAAALLYLRRRDQRHEYSDSKYGDYKLGGDSASTFFPRANPTGHIRNTSSLSAARHIRELNNPQKMDQIQTPGVEGVALASIETSNYGPTSTVNDGTIIGSGPVASRVAVPEVTSLSQHAAMEEWELQQKYIWEPPKPAPQRHELSGLSQPHELDGSNQEQELPA